MIKIFVGDIGLYLADAARKYDISARHITAATPSVLTPGCYYISYGDINDIDLFNSFVDQATDIQLCQPPDNWSDDKFKDGSSMMCAISKATVDRVSKRLQYSGTIPWVVNHLVGERKTDKRQLWVAGCSIAHGIGINPDQNFGNLLAQKINCPVTFLTKSGSSIAWASDQIIRSDINEGDIVVWALTERSRFTYYTDNNQNPVLFASVDKLKTKLEKTLLIEKLSSTDAIYQSLAAIMRVKNFCKKLNAELHLIDVFNDNLYQYFTDDPNAIYVPICDVGSDNYHPGYKSHKLYANTLFEKIIKKKN